MTINAPRLLVVDNVDSFTFMLVDHLRSLGAHVAVVRSDAVEIEHAAGDEFDGVVISPGPGRAEDAGRSIMLARTCIDRGRPLLGVCLGHQAIALACGGRIARVDAVHGKVAAVRHDGGGLFAGLPSPLLATRYHSLAVTSPTAPLIANAWSEDGTIMGLRHEAAPAHGVQFHPESVASEQGKRLLGAFLSIVQNNA